MGELHYFYEREAMRLEVSAYRTGSYHYNWHQEFELLVVLKGAIEVASAGLCQVLSEDDLVLINPNSGHATFSCASESVALVLHIAPSFFAPYFAEAERLSFWVVPAEGRRYAPEFAELRGELSRLAEAMRCGEPLFIEAAFYGLAASLVRHFPPRLGAPSFQPDEKKQQAMGRIIAYLRKNYRRKLSLEVLSEESGYSAGYLSQLFKANLGINFHDYLTRLRLREATRELSQGEGKILDVALAHGFSDLKSFNAVFKRTFRKSPSEYRRLLSEEHAVSDRSFKKEFLAEEDALVVRKLREYREAAYGKNSG